MRKPEEFKQKAIENKIRQWVVRDCSICGYQLKYIFYDDKVTFDPGCYCTSGREQTRTWDDISGYYNMQTNKNVIKEMDEFWGFEKEKISI